MLRDLEAGGQVEGDHIVGWMLERARKHGIDDTILSLAYTHLKAYEARRTPWAYLELSRTTEEKDPSNHCHHLAAFLVLVRRCLA